ncbi:hypothetical protein OAG68_01590 [bacterium]|nr:hypothetical protein [bacterium]
MKGLLVALLTLFTAGFAAAQQQADDEGGTFVLTLNGEQFANLIDNPEGLIARIPPDANVSKVVVKLAKDVRDRENKERVFTGKPGVPTSSAEIPALPQNQNVRTPSVIPATQDGFRNPNRGVENSQSSITIPFAPPSRFANAIPETPKPWIEFGDDTDFAPVVRESQFIQPRQRANHLADREFGSGLGEIRQPDTTTQRRNREFVATPEFERNPQFQNRDRSLDLARRDLGPVNLQPDIGRNNAVQPDDRTLRLVERLENGIEESKTMIANQDLKMNEQNRQINDLAYKLQQSQQREAMYVSALNGDYAESPTNNAAVPPRQDRIARNPQSPITTPRTTNVQNTSTEGQSSTQDATHLSPPPSNEMLANNQNLKKTNTFLLFMLLCSIGLNVYLGLIARSFYTRYAELADELRETFTASM